MSIFSFLNSYVPPALAIAGLSKVSPQLRKFIGYGSAVGYGSNEILDFLRSKAESQGYNSLRGKLQAGGKKGTLRPDEMAMQESINQTEVIPQVAKAAIAGGAGLAAGLIGKNKGNEEPSEDIQSVESPGTPAATPPISRSGKPTIQEHKTTKLTRSPEAIMPTLSEDETGEEFLAKYHPKLARDVSMRIHHGREPRDAALIVKENPGILKRVIQQIERDTMQSFEDLVHDLFGGGRKGPNPIERGKKSMRANQERVRAMEAMPEKTGGLNPNLAEALAAVQQALKR